MIWSFLYRAGRRESASGLTQQQMAMYEPGTFDLQVGAPVTDADIMLSCICSIQYTLLMSSSIKSSVCMTESHLPLHRCAWWARSHGSRLGHVCCPAQQSDDPRHAQTGRCFVLSVCMLTGRAHAWQGMTEKGIDQLRADLAAVDADCADQIRKTVHDNYHHFIQACQVCCPAHRLLAAPKS